MGTVHHTDEVFAAARDAGLRATIGKAMMDEDDPSIPAGLRESTEDSLAESERLCREWHERANGRLRYAFSPRFALSCTDRLLREVSERARERGARIHTHASENRSEIAEVEKRRGLPNIEYLAEVGMVGGDVGLAHCVWVNPAEAQLLASTGTHLLHCPSSNLKLASGVAEIPELMAAGVAVSLGADGAPCNNNLDAFVEMRLAALIHKPRIGPRAMPAATVIEMATMGGARALGLESQIGSLEVGKRADVIAVDITRVHVAPVRDPLSAIVYSCRGSDVRHVVVDGQVVVRDHELLTLDRAEVVALARERADRVFSRI
jgi:cytosine/adenosine deaminase-related metal-dependent hydrolase